MMRAKTPPKPRLKCFLCQRVRASRWIVVADYFSSKRLRIEARGIKIGLCTPCWFGKNVFDMSCFYKVERKLCDIFNREIPQTLVEGEDVEPQSAVKEVPDGQC